MANCDLTNLTLWCNAELERRRDAQRVKARYENKCACLHVCQRGFEDASAVILVSPHPLSNPPPTAVCVSVFVCVCVSILVL